MNLSLRLPFIASAPEAAARPAGPPLTGERMARARLARTPRIGPVTFHEMVGHYGSAAAALDALPSLAKRAGFQSAPRPPGAAALRDEADALAALGGRFVIAGDADYPAALTQLGDAPPVLSVIGDAALLSRSAIAVVGARNASVGGRRLATDFAAGLGGRGFVVVSGLARGVDTAAHRAALPTGTVAVLAGGVDVVYPPENDDLYREIAAAGAIVSEAPLGAVPQARHFPRRNRIVSGLSLGVLVVEAALQSGSLITARQAADQGREVFAIPGSPLDPRARGCNRLIRDGAHLVEEIADIAAILPDPAAAPAPPPRPLAPPAPAPKRRRTRPAEPAPMPLGGGQSGHDDPSPTPGVDAQPIEFMETSDPEAVAERIAAALTRAPTPVDEIIRCCHVSPAAATAALLDLELAGRIERRPGNMIALI
ncbi:MAG: DNA-protecting protein DprA [Rhodospirillales bacterium]|nr:MAG: DNA-protecting protein DprA [Rhodospirillales bacterium]